MTHAELLAARAALKRIKSRENEDVVAWAKALANDGMWTIGENLPLPKDV
jgi:hypothetical protein